MVCSYRGRPRETGLAPPEPAPDPAHHPTNEQGRYILLQEGVYIVSHRLEYRDTGLIIVAQVHDCADLTPAREVVRVPAGEIVCGGERVEPIHGRRLSLTQLLCPGAKSDSSPMEAFQGR
jgi:hypothetical protein